MNSHVNRTHHIVFLAAWEPIGLGKPFRGNQLFFFYNLFIRYIYLYILQLKISIQANHREQVMFITS